MEKSWVLVFLLFASLNVQAQPRSYAQDVAVTAMNIWQSSFILQGQTTPGWHYDQGVILKGIEGIWLRTGEGKWFNYIKKSMDYYVQEDGSIKGYKPDEYNIDYVNNGKLLLLLYRVTGEEKYSKAARLLRSQLLTHPRTSEGSFWHKNIYPHQVWLDGLYMAQPFYAEYAKEFGEDSVFDDITKQFTLIERHGKDAKTGLLYHGWDESKSQKWADKTTGLSPNFWGRSLGWYGMAMVDVLDHYPDTHPGRDSIIKMLNRFAKAVTAVQDPRTGLWYNVPNLPDEPKNYLEASASSMLVYALAKGIRKKYLPSTYLTNAIRGYDGLIKKFISVNDGQTELHGTVSVSGLGGNPYRDGSFAYYMSEPVIVNDPKGMGAFISAANEMELMSTFSFAKGKTVLLDYYFNNERKSGSTGKPVRWHYNWHDKSNGGFFVLGEIFRGYGAQTKCLDTRPTNENLKGADVYIIVDPDSEKETEHPALINERDAAIIATWVKQGGALVLMGNDSANNNLKSLNTLSTKFGIRLNEDLFNTVEGVNFEQGAISIPYGNRIFSTPKKIYVKELATLTVKPWVEKVLTKKGKTIIATVKWGKGIVFVIGDPWLYNEYIDGRKLPDDFENFKAAQDLVKWTLLKSKRK